ncbi:hypothetical protein F4810DRAFT_710238 [Camillea tinctor]|nr:hypothetical protein F4810DRAFT_710238 [Camillea tinctor]
MLRRRRGVGGDIDDGATRRDFAFPSSLAGTNTASQVAIHDNVLIRPSAHNPSRVGYSEEKCRNVLVRYCAHIPRNYQYKDGIQQIFLILREHLGDENLDLAGGVLYELIEIDCEYSDDHGAAFQRWRHDHMCRYADLELPHIPHMTTITSSIIPTDRLTRWRFEHPERYPFVLSDSSPSSQRLSSNTSCIRNRKAWLIDHTLYVSSRNNGTRPLQSPNPKEFHEMQWNLDYGGKGRLVREHQVVLTSLDRPSEPSPPGTSDTLSPSSSRTMQLRHSLSRLSIIEKIVDRLGKHRKQPETGQRRRSWVPSSLMFETASFFKEKRTTPDNLSIPLPDGCQIPNAIFARKFLLVDNGDALPPYLSTNEMPTAESKAIDTVVEAAASGVLDGDSPWSFRGPFTPQLGYDGGLDYRWGFCDPNITVRRFDIEIPIPEILKFRTDSRDTGVDATKETDGKAAYNTQFERKYAVNRTKHVPEKHASVNTERKPKASSLQKHDQPDTQLHERYNTPRGSTLLYPPCTPTNPSKFAPNTQFATGNLQYQSLRRRKPSLFDGIEFAVPKGYSNVSTPAAHRKTTVVERPGGYPESSPCVFDANYTRKPGNEHRPGDSLDEPLASQNDFVNHCDKKDGCFEYMHMEDRNRDSSVFDEHGNYLNLANESQEVIAERLKPLKYDGSDKEKGDDERQGQYQEQNNLGPELLLEEEKATITPPSIAINCKGARGSQVLDWLESGSGNNVEDPNSLIPLPDLEYAATRRHQAASYALDRDILAISPWQRQQLFPLAKESTPSAHHSSSVCATNGRSTQVKEEMRVLSSSSEEKQRSSTNTTNNSRKLVPSRLPIPRFRYPSKHSTFALQPHGEPVGRKHSDHANIVKGNTNKKKSRHSSASSCSLTPATDPDLPASYIPDRRSSIRVIKQDLSLHSPVSPVHGSSASCHPSSNQKHQLQSQSHPSTANPTPAVKPVLAPARKLKRMSGSDRYGFYYDSGDDSTDGPRGIKNKGKGVDRGQSQRNDSGDSENNLRLSEAGRYQQATMYSGHRGYEQGSFEEYRAPTAAPCGLSRGTPPQGQGRYRTAKTQAQVHTTPVKQQDSALSSQQQHQQNQLLSHRKQQPSGSSVVSVGHSRRDHSAISSRASPFKAHQHHRRQNSNDAGSSDFVGGVRPSPERGRSRQRRRYELPSDDESEDDALSTVQETGKSNMTTFTDIIRQGLEPSPSRSPASRTPSRHRSPPRPIGDTSVPPVPTLPPVTTLNRAHRPTGLDMSAASRFGNATGRHANIQVVHNPLPASPSAPELSVPQKTMLQASSPGPSRGHAAPTALSPKLDKGKQPERVQVKSRRAHRNSKDSRKDELRYSSSVYEWDEDLPTISPLHIPKRGEMMKVDILQQYNKWWQDSSMAATRRAEFPASPMPLIHDQGAKHKTILHNIRSRSEMGRRDVSSGERAGASSSNAAPHGIPPQQQRQPLYQGGSIPKSATTSDIRDEGDNQFRSDSRPQLESLSEPFTPLTPWLMAGGMSGMAGGLSSKKKSKVLIGKDGYLEDTAAQAQTQDHKKKGENSKSIGGFFGKCRDIARELAETSFRPPRPKMGAVKKFEISLDPREQSLVYCELEFELSSALDEYIKNQLNNGRLSPDKLKKVADAWAARGRPNVTGFRYDLETQVDLVEAHIDHFRFHSNPQVDPVAIRGLLHSMKTNARQMRARTYCQPDTVVLKHLKDAASFMKMIGSPDHRQTRLDQISQFFKCIMAREKEFQAKMEERERARSNGEVIRDSVNDHDNGGPTGTGISNEPPNAKEQLINAKPYTSGPHEVGGNNNRHGDQGDKEKQSQTQIQQESSQEEPRQFSGPILEPKTYSPADDEPAFVR